MRSNYQGTSFNGSVLKISFSSDRTSIKQGWRDIVGVGSTDGTVHFAILNCKCVVTLRVQDGGREGGRKNGWLGVGKDY